MSEPITEQAPARDPYAVFRPRRGRAATWGLAAAQLVVLSVVAVVLPADGPAGFALADRLGIVAVAALIAAFLVRLGSVRAVPSPQGLQVRNMLLSQSVQWPQIVQVNFGGGQPWLSLDLADGESLVVMAVQRADGPRAEKEARRMAALVAQHSRTAGND